MTRRVPEFYEALPRRLFHASGRHDDLSWARRRDQGHLRSRYRTRVETRGRDRRRAGSCRCRGSTRRSSSTRRLPRPRSDCCTPITRCTPAHRAGRNRMIGKAGIFLIVIALAATGSLRAKRSIPPCAARPARRGGHACADHADGAAPRRRKRELSEDAPSFRTASTLQIDIRGKQCRPATPRRLRGVAGADGRHTEFMDRDGEFLPRCRRAVLLTDATFRRTS